MFSYRDILDFPFSAATSWVVGFYRYPASSCGPKEMWSACSKVIRPRLGAAVPPVSLVDVLSLHFCISAALSPTSPGRNWLPDLARRLLRTCHGVHLGQLLLDVCDRLCEATLLILPCIRSHHWESLLQSHLCLDLALHYYL
ncbi:unnamed protein product [Linum trigynum]|uniref:Uncharacterized protein n=1 Tax=Linum trigynum TaxID=586398 RepID=A0AAV2DYN6_9ROSI